MYEEHEVTPPTPSRRRPTLAGYHAVITPESPVAMPLWRLMAGIGAIVVGSIAGWRCYDGLQQSVTAARVDIVGVRADLAKLGPANVRDECRRVVEEELRRPLLVECPKHVIKGEAVTRCPVISRDER